MMSPQTSTLSESQPHLHIAGELCPWCEQPIPHEKFEEITARIEATERSRAVEDERRLRENLAAERVQIENKAQADLEAAKRESEAAIGRLAREAQKRETVAREEGRKAAEAVAAEERAAEWQSAQQEKLTLQEKLQAADLAKAAIERERAEMEARFSEFQQQSSTREAAACEESARAAEAAAATTWAAERLVAQQEKRDLEQRLLETDESRRTAEQGRNESALQLAALIESITAREAAAHDQGRHAAKAEAAEALEAAGEARRLAEGELQAFKASQGTELQLRLQEQREALEKERADAINAERSHAFDEKLKLEGKLQEVQRQLQNKTAAELGEGAEVDLYETLRSEFPDDRVRRVSKGVSGADIIHDVMHHGKVCGSVIYDSKNCSAWRTDYATKLRQDQLAAKADHAVLAIPVFPAGTRQLHVVEGVILANPARVTAIAQILRKQIVQVHSLRLSADQRDQKATLLYAFITSDRSSQLFERMGSATKELEEVDVKEAKSHQAVWRKRGELIRSIQRHQAEFSLELDRIIGTAEGEEDR